MSLLSIETTGQCRIGIWRLEESLQEISSGLPDVPVCTAKAGQRQLEYYAEQRLALAMGIRPSDIGHLPTGAPTLADGSAISISHTKDYVCLMHGPRGLRIGIDVEMKAPRILKVEKWYLRESEQELIKAAATCDDRRMKMDLLYWCSKEALYKAAGIEGLDLCHEFDICDFHAVSENGEDPTEGQTMAYLNEQAFRICWREWPDAMLIFCFSE